MWMVMRSHRPQQTFCIEIDMTESAFPIVFLDIDGVTHPEPCFHENVMCRMDSSAAVLNRYPQIDIVISSAGRMQFTLPELQDFLCEIAPHRVFDVPPSIKKPSPDWVPGVFSLSERQWEIETWLKTNRPFGTTWIAIDDRAFWFEKGCKHLLLTDKKTGFTDADAILLEAMIQERL
jgi:hypothetical protein